MCHNNEAALVLYVQQNTEEVRNRLVLGKRKKNNRKLLLENTLEHLN